MIKNLKLNVQSRLDHLNPRERRLVLGGGAFGALALVWAFLIEPPLQTLRQAPKELGGKQEQAARVLQAAAELEALRGARSKVVVQQTELEPRLRQLLVEEGLEQTATLGTTEEGEFKIEFDNTSAAAWLKWVGKVDAISSIQLQIAEVNKTEAGLVSGTVVILPNASKPSSSITNGAQTP